MVLAGPVVPLLLVPLAASAWFVAGRWRWASAAAAGAALLGAEALLLLDNQAEFNDFKAIYAPLHTPDARVVATVLSPRGDYTLLDDFTERVDTDISNNAGMLGVPGPPQTFGLYRDGNRIAALPKPGALGLVTLESEQLVEIGEHDGFLSVGARTTAHRLATPGLSGLGEEQSRAGSSRDEHDQSSIKSYITRQADPSQNAQPSGLPAGAICPSARRSAAA